MNYNDRVRQIISIFTPSFNMEMFKDNPDIGNYELANMMPKVTYDDWIVCLYLNDNKLYALDEESVTEVNAIHVVEYDVDFSPMDALEDDGDYCGEADDMSCYVYFERVEQKGMW